MPLITTEELENTETYKSLSFIARQFLVKRANREIINNAIIVHRNTKVIPGNITGTNLLIVKELISLNNMEPEL
jgi:hypothetical protein